MTRFSRDPPKTLFARRIGLATKRAVFWNFAFAPRAKGQCTNMLSDWAKTGSPEVALPTERESGGKTLGFPRGPPRPRTGAETHPPEADDAVPATPAVTWPFL